MVEVDLMIASGYVIAIIVLILGLIYGVYKAIKGE